MNETLNICQALKKYKRIVQPISGNSMLPMLDEEKDAVELVAVSGPLQKYDLPLYQRPNGKLVLHRIIDVKKKHYLTCGDNRTDVEKVPMDWVIAVASGFFKDGTYVSCQDEKYLAYVQTHWENFPQRQIIKKNPDADNVEIYARKGIQKKGAGKYFWGRVFLPYSQMCMYYPCLWKMPILLPVFWVVRWVTALFYAEKRRKGKVEMKEILRNKKNG
ncbi:MAG: S24/S26 family peptidase [Oscillospiraceae bacterium]|nr:S24/S26 family peptidase [Oscillospiraceae bacterium]